MKGMFVADDGCIRYAEAIAKGLKRIETRNRNTLANLLGEKVAIVRTRRGKNPTVVGYVHMFCVSREDRGWLDDHRMATLIPVGSKYDTAPKWCYWLDDAEECEPYPLPANAVRHGRSWCEFNA